MQLKVALMAIEPIRDAFLASDNPSLQKIGNQLDPCTSVSKRIEKEIKPDPPH